MPTAPTAAALLLLLITALVQAQPRPADAPRQPAPPPELKKLHILMVFDTNDERLASSLLIDEKRLGRLWASTIPATRHTARVLTGKEVTATAIMDHYRKLKLGQDEGVLFFYGGHGAADPKKGNYLDLQAGKPLIRSDLRRAMEATGAGLVLILTDCCSTPVKLPTKRERALPQPVSPERIAPTVRCLLFQARGTVDVTAATGNASWSDSERGGLFTRALVALLGKPVTALDRNKDGFVTWQEAFPVLQRDTEVLFDGWLRDLRASKIATAAKSQRPHAFLLGKRLASESQAHAVLSVENATGEAMTYRYRWAGQTAWQSQSLGKGERHLHALPLKDDASPPELEAQFEGIRAVQRLKSRRWVGKAEPQLDDARQAHYRIRPRSK